MKREATRPVDALEELERSMGRVRLLMDACDDWLRDVEDPRRYDLGLRADEVMVVYLEDDLGRLRRRKATLAALLAIVDARFTRVGVEPRRADPRTLILRTAHELRQTVLTAVELARLLADAQAMQALRDALLTEIAKVDEGVAQRIAEAIRQTLVLHEIDSGPGALAAGE